MATLSRLYTSILSVLLKQICCALFQLCEHVFTQLTTAYCCSSYSVVLTAVILFIITDVVTMNPLYITLISSLLALGTAYKGERYLIFEIPLPSTQRLLLLLSISGNFLLLDIYFDNPFWSVSFSFYSTDFLMDIP